MNKIQTSGVPSFSLLSEARMMDTNTQQSHYGHKRVAISAGARLLNAIMAISAGARILKVVMTISTGTRVLKAHVMAISRLLGIKLHKPPTSNVVIIELSFHN